MRESVGGWHGLLGQLWRYLLVVAGFCLAPVLGPSAPHAGEEYWRQQAETD